jgi:hypothetical protein
MTEISSLLLLFTCHLSWWYGQCFRRFGGRFFIIIISYMYQWQVAWVLISRRTLYLYNSRDCVKRVYSGCLSKRITWHS